VPVGAVRMGKSLYGLSSLDDGFLGSYIVPLFVCYVNFIVAVDFWL
jgi:hypothetical protein